MPTIPNYYYDPTRAGLGKAPRQGGRVNQSLLSPEFEGKRSVAAGVDSLAGGIADGGKAVLQRMDYEDRLQSAQVTQSAQSAAFDASDAVNQAALKLNGITDGKFEQWEAATKTAVDKAVDGKSPKDLRGVNLERWTEASRQSKQRAYTEIAQLREAKRVGFQQEKFKNNAKRFVESAAENFSPVLVESFHTGYRRFLNQSVVDGIINENARETLDKNFLRSVSTKAAPGFILRDPAQAVDVFADEKKRKEMFPGMTNEEYLVNHRQSIFELHRTQALNGEQVLNSIIKAGDDIALLDNEQKNLDALFAGKKITAKLHEELSASTRDRINSTSEKQTAHYVKAKQAILDFEPSLTGEKLFDQRAKVAGLIGGLKGRRAQELWDIWTEAKESKWVLQKPEMRDLSMAARDSFNNGLFGTFKEKVEKKDSRGRVIAIETRVDEKKQAEAQMRYFSVLDNLAAYKIAHPNSTRTELLKELATLTATSLEANYLRNLQEKQK
jgi:hypothetical protein